MNQSFTRKLLVAPIVALILGLFLAGCGGEEHEADLVDSGTYTGTLMEVKPEEKEIYVKADNGKTIELYLKKETELVDASDNTIPFSDLSRNEKVEVKVKKVGQRNDPIRVQQLEE